MYSLLIIAFVSFACSLKEQKFENGFSYKEDEERQIKLPKKISEISGIDFVDEQVFVCVNDEEGIVYFFNTKSREIEREIVFAENGDYEGIAIADKDIYVLRSDSRIYRIQNYISAEPEITHYDLNLPADDNEGLCYDSKRNRLILAPKAQFEHDKHAKYRPIFEFSLVDMEKKRIPIINLDLSEIAEKMEDVDLDKESDFWITDICYDAANDDFFLITSKHLLVSIDMNGKILGFEKLDNKRLEQPEGIIFHKDGSLVIASEASKNQKATVNFYNLEEK